MKASSVASTLFIVLIALSQALGDSGTVATAKSCKQFSVLSTGTQDLPEGWQVVGPNLILDEHNELVLTDPSVIEFGQPENFTIIQGVSGQFYGEPLCIAVIDCGAAGTGEVQCDVVNNQRPAGFDTTSGIVLKEICSNPGVFFGCVNTAYVNDNTSITGSGITKREMDPSLPGFVVGQFGDELVVQYVASQPTNGNYVKFHYSVWLSTQQHRYWSFETISDLMFSDSVDRNIEKLTALKLKVQQLSSYLFSNPSATCEDIGIVKDLGPTALQSFEFLDCIVERNEHAESFLNQTLAIGGTSTRSLLS